MKTETNTEAEEVAVDVPRLVRLGLKKYMLEDYDLITPDIPKYPIALDAAMRLDKWLRKQKLEYLFPNGMPVKKPYYRRTGNTCKCWGCSYCRGVLVGNSIKRIREERFEPNSKDNQPRP